MAFLGEDDDLHPPHQLGGLTHSSSGRGDHVARKHVHVLIPGLVDQVVDALGCRSQLFQQRGLDGGKILTIALLALFGLLLGRRPRPRSLACSRLLRRVILAKEVDLPFALGRGPLHTLALRSSGVAHIFVKIASTDVVPELVSLLLDALQLAGAVRILSLQRFQVQELSSSRESQLRRALLPVRHDLLQGRPQVFTSEVAAVSAKGFHLAARNLGEVFHQSSVVLLEPLHSRAQAVAALAPPQLLALGGPRS